MHGRQPEQRQINAVQQRAGQPEHGFVPPKKRKPVDRDIIRTVKRYLSQRPDAVYRNRSEYLQHIETYLMGYRRKDLWEIYGKELQALLGYTRYESTEEAGE